MNNVMPQTYVANIYFIPILLLVYITADSTQSYYKLFISHYSYYAESLSWHHSAIGSPALSLSLFLSAFNFFF